LLNNITTKQSIVVGITIVVGIVSYLVVSNNNSRICAAYLSTKAGAVALHWSVSHTDNLKRQAAQERLDKAGC
jgi:hypothetical protein